MAKRVVPQVTDDWHRLYKSGWKGAIVDEAFAHPAKFARDLIRAIYDHAVEEGWLRPGDRVLDPFGGVALGALDAMRLGLNWVGMELEPKFVGLGTQNIQLWDGQFKSVIPGWGTAWLYQGDSRYLALLLEQADLGGHRAAVSSPPYAGSVVRGGTELATVPLGKRWAEKGESVRPDESGYGAQPGQLGEMSEGDLRACDASPPYEGGGLGHDRGESGRQREESGKYGRLGVSSYPTEYGTGGSGQLGSMPGGDFGLSVTSPPFGAGETRDRAPVQDGSVSDCITRAYTQDRQGVVEGNLAHLDDGEGFEASIASPPFVSSVGSDDPDRRGGLYRDPKRRNDVNLTGTYGETPGQLGAMDGEFEIAVSLPPYEGQKAHPSIGSVGKDNWGEEGTDIVERRGLSGEYGNTPGQLGAMGGGGEFRAAVGSPPFEESLSGKGACPEIRPDGSPFGQGKSIDLADYGSTPGQLGTLSGGLPASISSPPWERGAEGGLREEKFKDPEAFAAQLNEGDQADPSRHNSSIEARLAQMERDQERVYGTTEGQLGDMSSGYDASVTSPPYLPRSDRRIPAGGDHEALQRRDEEAGYAPVSTFRTSYSDDPDNLGNPTGADQETFWGAAKTIVEQVYQLLSPGGVAIWVCKDFVRNKQRVPFTHQWAQLCVSVGFEWLHEHRCWVVEDNGTQLGLFGEEDDVDLVKERKSFFRRLAERRGSPRIDYESVLCLRKPL